MLRTPDDRFASLPGYPYPPRYVAIADRELGELHMNHVDTGPADAAPVLLLHGQPTWSYLYRKVIAGLVARGHRCVAPDLIGYGRSDKPDDRFAYTFEAHVRWLRGFVEALDLRGVTLVCQDWGGPLGLAVLAALPDRFARVVAANTILHTSDEHLAGRLTWANHGIADGRVVLQEALVDYLAYTMRAGDFTASTLVRFATTTDVPDEVLAAYDAPVPRRAAQGRRAPDDRAPAPDPQRSGRPHRPAHHGGAADVGQAVPHRLLRRRPGHRRLGARLPG